MWTHSLVASLAAALGLTAAAFGLAAIERILAGARTDRESRATRPRRERFADLLEFARELWEQRTAAASPAVRFGLLVWLAAGLFAFAPIPFGTTPHDAGGTVIPHPVIVPGLAAGLLWAIAAWGSSNVAGIVAAESPADLNGAVRRGTYFIPLVVALFGAVATSGTLVIEGVIASQIRSGVWNVFPHPLGCLGFLLCAAALAGGASNVATDSAFSSLRRGFPAAFALGRAMQRLLAAYLIVVVYLGGWHAWAFTADGEAIAGWGEWSLSIIVLHAKVLAVLWAWTRWSGRIPFGEKAWLVALALGLFDFAVAIIPFERLFGEEAWLARAAIGWCAVVALIGFRK
ncbi:MAG: NADH-quinone oxidoreductase subunit H [Planctomycetaceae bacterium]